MSVGRGWPSSEKRASVEAQHATIEPTGKEQYGLTVNARVFVYQAGSDAAETGSTTEVIVATAHVAQLGDVVRFTSGTLTGREVKVIAVSANAITVSDELESAPANGDVFLIMRPRYPQVDVDGNLIVATTPGPVQFVLNSVDTEVEEDTGTPGDSRPLPVKVFRTNGTSDWSDDVETALVAIQGSTQATALDIDSLEANFGSAADAAAAGDTSTATFVALFKRSLQHLSSLIAKDFSTETTLSAVDGWLNQLNAVFGLQSDAAATTDTGTFSFVSLFKRSLQKLTLINTDTTALVAKDFATETTLAGAAVDLSSIDAKVPSQGQAAMAASVPVVIASNQTAVPVSQTVNANGSMVNDTLVSTTAETATAPANAVGFILAADDDNSDPIRYAIGATASTTVGTRMAPGRDTGYVPCAANISICATASTGSNGYTIQWILSV